MLAHLLDASFGTASRLSTILPFSHALIVSAAAPQGKQVNVKRLSGLRASLKLFDLDTDPENAWLRVMLIRCVIHPLYLRLHDGKVFLAGLSRDFHVWGWECVAQPVCMTPNCPE